VRVLSADESAEGVAADYSWATAPERRAGRIVLTLRDSTIARVVVSIESDR